MIKRLSLCRHSSPDCLWQLYLQLQDFATETLVEAFGSLCDRIYISAATLYTYLERDENITALIKPGRGWARKRPRDSTPPEELEREHENTFREEEKRVAEKGYPNRSSGFSD
jgi:hypothetical protein